MTSFARSPLSLLTFAAVVALTLPACGEDGASTPDDGGVGDSDGGSATGDWGDDGWTGGDGGGDGGGTGTGGGDTGGDGGGDGGDDGGATGDDGGGGDWTGDDGDSGTDWTGDAGGTTGGGTDEGTETGGTDTGDTQTTDSGTTTEPACDDQNDTVLYLSPDDSNSMSSPVQAREAVLNGWNGLGNVALRTWEFLNYYSFDYPAAAPGDVGVYTQMSTDAGFDPGEYLLQIGVSSEILLAAQRPPINLTLVLDQSGSMSGHPIEMLRQVCLAIAASLKAGDKVSMVTWSTTNNIVLGGYEVDGPNDALLVGKINDISAAGGTNLAAGLSTGYELAQSVWDPNRINRVVLISDGGANVGVTSEELIAERAGGQNEDGIYMVGVGVGTASSYNDLLMDTVTDAGKGASVFIPDQGEAWTVFNQNFVNTMAVAARDVQVELDMPPGFEIVTFSGEEYSTDPEEVEPQHLAPNDAMVFHQRIRTCAPELATDDAEITVTARFKDALTFEEREVSETKTFADLLDGDQAMLLKGAAIYAYAEALKTRAGQAKQAVTVGEALAAVAAAEGVLPGDMDLAEIREVLEAL